MLRRAAGPFSLRTAHRWAGAALLFLYVIVISGATVRLTGSGLGCPDWPTCSGTRPVPELEHHAMIEFVNRMISTPTTICCVGACWVAWRLTTRRRDLRIATALTLFGIPVQIALGALTIMLELPWYIVSMHFLTSIAMLSTATWAWMASARHREISLRSAADKLALGIAVAMLASLLAVIVAGVATTASGPHSGAEMVERLGNAGTAVTVHARGAYVFAALLFVLIGWRVRTRAGARDLLLVTVLVVAQITLGEIQYRTGLPWEIVLAHVANAALLWIVSCAVAYRALAYRDPARPSRGDGERAGDAGRMHEGTRTPVAR